MKRLAPASEPPDTPLPAPLDGGSYRRESDGSLTLLERACEPAYEAAVLAPQDVAASNPASEVQP